MEANKILQSDILDIIFEGKNKLYGAYQLRKNYNRTMVKALTTTAGIFLLIFLGTIVAGKGKKNIGTLLVGKDIIISKVKELPPPLAIIPVPPVAVIPNQVRSVTPIVVDDVQVTPEDIILDITDLTAISNKTIQSDNTVAIIQAPVTDSNTTIVEKPIKQNTDKIFTTVEIDAAYPGGFPAWKKYLENNLDAETGVNNGAPAGTYTVFVRFVVSKDGSISNVIPETKIGYGLEAEAIKIITKGPMWIPARQNGQYVNAYRSQPITFVVNE